MRLVPPFQFSHSISASSLSSFSSIFFPQLDYFLQMIFVFVCGASFSFLFVLAFRIDLCFLLLFFLFFLFFWILFYLWFYFSISCDGGGGGGHLSPRAYCDRARSLLIYLLDVDLITINEMRHSCFSFFLCFFVSLILSVVTFGKVNKRRWIWADGIESGDDGADCMK